MTLKLWHKTLRRENYTDQYNIVQKSTWINSQVQLSWIYKFQPLSWTFQHKHCVPLLCRWLCRYNIGSMSYERSCSSISTTEIICLLYNHLIRKKKVSNNGNKRKKVLTDRRLDEWIEKLTDDIKQRNSFLLRKAASQKTSLHKSCMMMMMMMIHIVIMISL